MQSHQIGFYEFFLLCEDLGAEPLPVVWVGMNCQARRRGKIDMESEAFRQDVVQTRWICWSTPTAIPPPANWRPRVQTKTLQQIVDKNLTPDTKVECDGYGSYLNLEGVELNAKKYAPGDLHWLHKAISNLKTFLLGTYHGRCTKLQAYLDEYCFRFNRRLTGNQLFLRLARAVATSCGVLS